MGDKLAPTKRHPFIHEVGAVYRALSNFAFFSYALFSSCPNLFVSRAMGVCCTRAHIAYVAAALPSHPPHRRAASYTSGIRRSRCALGRTQLTIIC